MYTIAMAPYRRSRIRRRQFFINTKNNSFLDYPGQDGWGYCVFGKVVEGKVKTGSSEFFQDVPKEDVIITSAEVK